MSTSCRAAAPPGAASAKPQRRRSWPPWRTRSSPSPASASAACRSWITTCRRARPDLRRIKRLAVTLFVLGAAPLADAQWAVAATESKGEYVARAGDCVACHSVPGGKAFAGGLKMGLPFGVIYSTNITPDPETGIGKYSREDFDRAVRSGVAKDGRRLYPAMPYPSYAKLTNADVATLYDFFMKEVPPVQQANLPNEIPRLLSYRWPLAMWNLAFTTGGSYVAKSGHDAEWNRGAYLVQGLGHCGACHTPRGVAWQEKALDEGSSIYLS